jgi:hypothetical protein
MSAMITSFPVFHAEILSGERASRKENVAAAVQFGILVVGWRMGGNE